MGPNKGWGMIVSLLQSGQTSLDLSGTCFNLTINTCGGDRMHLNCVSCPVYLFNTIILQLSLMEYCLVTAVNNAYTKTNGKPKFRLKIHRTQHFIQGNFSLRWVTPSYFRPGMYRCGHLCQTAQHCSKTVGNPALHFLGKMGETVKNKIKTKTKWNKKFNTVQTIHRYSVLNTWLPPQFHYFELYFLYLKPFVPDDELLSFNGEGQLSFMYGTDILWQR